jgi:hypothetical protein
MSHANGEGVFFILKADRNGHNAYIIPGAKYIDVRYLAGSAEAVTIPTGYNYVLFSANADFYVRWDGGTAAIPVGDTTDGTGSEMNPTARDVSHLTTFSIIGAVDTIVTMAYYK